MSHTAQQTSEPSDSDEPLVKVSGPSGLLGCIPFMIGFQPEESLILVFMSPPPRRVVLTLRLDLAAGDDPDYFAIMQDMLASTSQRASAHGVDLDLAHLVVFSESAEDLPAEDLVIDTAEALARTGVRPGEMFASDGERLWFYPSDDVMGCCPGEGHRLDRAEFEAAQFALVTNGYGYLASRRDLEHTLDPMPDQCFDDAAWQRVQDERRDATAAGNAAALQWRRQAEDVMYGAFTSGDVDLELIRANAAYWALALSEAQVREPLLFRTLFVPSPDSRRLALSRVRSWLTELAVRCPQPALAPVAATLAAVAWQDGDGAFARLAAERAQQADPSNSLATLIGTAAISGVPPSAWLDVLRAFGLEGLRNGDKEPIHPEFLERQRRV